MSYKDQSFNTEGKKITVYYFSFYCFKENIKLSYTIYIQILRDSLLNFELLP